MALVWRVSSSPMKAPGKGKFSYSEWYAKNKERLLAKKKKLYEENPTYRNAIKNRSKNQRKRVEVPHDEFTLSMQEVSDRVGVSIWTLREWRRKNYFPEPLHRLGRLWFSHTQAQWLERLNEFFISKGMRTRNADRKELDQLVEMIYAHWN
jgi:hypothetical protein